VLQVRGVRVMLAWRKRVKGTVQPFRGAVAGCAQLLRVQLRGVVSTPQGVHLSDGWKRLKDLTIVKSVRLVRRARNMFGRMAVGLAESNGGK
jgi:hypothetical protein